MSSAITVPPCLAAAIVRRCQVQFGAEMAHGQVGWMGHHLGFDIPDPEEPSGMGEDGTPGGRGRYRGQVAPPDTVGVLENRGEG